MHPFDDQKEALSALEGLSRKDSADLLNWAFLERPENGHVYVFGPHLFKWNRRFHPLSVGAVVQHPRWVCGLVEGLDSSERAEFDPNGSVILKSAITVSVIMTGETLGAVVPNVERVRGASSIGSIHLTDESWALLWEQGLIRHCGTFLFTAST